MLPCCRKTPEPHAYSDADRDVERDEYPTLPFRAAIEETERNPFVVQAHELENRQDLDSLELVPSAHDGILRCLIEQDYAERKP
jgi:hypothetical protein